MSRMSLACKQRVEASGSELRFLCALGGGTLRHCHRAQGIAPPGPWCSDMLSYSSFGGRFRVLWAVASSVHCQESFRDSADIG